MSRKISGYKMVREIGHGGMSTVYLAIQTSVNRYVALKVMSPHLVDDESFTQRFLSEARIAARFRHPNIISILDVNVSEGVPYIAMEYVPGGELNTDRIKSMDLTEKLSVLVQIADALGFLHTQNFVHRDIKPANILFREDKSVVLTDFGVARDQTANTGMTLTGYIIGTPHYLSPEQAQGGTVDARSDLYSLGVLMFRILTARLPYVADDAIALCTMHINADIPDLPEEFEKFDPIVKKAMAKSPDDRYQSANEFIDDLIAVTGSKTAKLLRRSVEGVALQAIRAEDVDTTRREQIPVGEAELQTVHRIGADTISLDRENSERIREIRSTKKVRRWVRESWQSFRENISALKNQEHPRAGDSSPPNGKSRALLLGASVVVVALVVTLVWWSVVDGPEPDSGGGRQKARIDDPVTTESTVVDVAEPVQPRSTQDSQNVDMYLVRGFEALENGIYVLPEETSALAYFEKVLAQDPNNLQAISGLESLAGSLMDLAQIEISNGRATVATQLISDARQIRGADTARLAQLESDLARLRTVSASRATEISTRLERGYEYLQQNQLTRPEDANAVAEFNQVLQLDDTNERALAGLRQVGERYLVLSRDQLTRGNPEKAEEYWQNANEISPGLPGSPEVRKLLDEVPLARTGVEPRPESSPGRPGAAGMPSREISPYRLPALQLSGRESLDALHKQAEQAMKSGNRMRAYSLYKAVWNRDPDFGRAGRRLNSGAGSFINVASRDIVKGDLFAANENLSIALALDASHPKFDSVRRDYLAALDKQASITQAGSRRSLMDIQIKTLMDEAEDHHRRFEQDLANRASAQKARQTYREVLAMNPNYAPARNGLDRLFNDLLQAASQAMAQSRKEDAGWFLAQASEMNPRNSELRSLENQLNSQ